ncbi:MAG: hypothetical protein IJR66_01690 [Clostridia bacterium]|nr:hypothetical protein [Clostridia bacterium]
MKIFDKLMDFYEKTLKIAIAVMIALSVYNLVISTLGNSSYGAFVEIMKNVIYVALFTLLLVAFCQKKNDLLILVLTVWFSYIFLKAVFGSFSELATALARYKIAGKHKFYFLLSNGIQFLVDGGIAFIGVLFIVQIIKKEESFAQLIKIALSVLLVLAALMVIMYVIGKFIKVVGLRKLSIPVFNFGIVYLFAGFYRPMLSMFKIKKTSGAEKPIKKGNAKPLQEDDEEKQ